MPALGRLKQDHFSDKLALTRKVMREAVLQQSTGADYWQEAIVLEIDPIGGMMGDPVLGVGNPRFSIRARLIESTGENTNSDSLRDTDELKVCFPALDMYHVQYPIKYGEKVWVFEKTGIDGVSQRYWVTRSPSLTPVSLEDFARPNNNYANASFEANLFRTPDETGGEDRTLDINIDAKRVDLVDKLSAQNPNEFSDIAPDQSRSRTYFSNVVDRESGRYGFVSEAFPELFTRPSDYVAQGSNNNALILGTNAVSIESEEERPDIADILSIYGYSNDASGFTNARDAEVNIEELSPIAAGATPKKAFADLVVGREFNFVSYTFDKSRVTVFEGTNIDSLIPGYSDTITTIKGTPSEEGPAALMRSDNIRLSARNSVAITVGSSAGLFLDTEEGGKLVGNLPFKIELDINNVNINASQDNFLLNVGEGSSLEMNNAVNLNAQQSISIDSLVNISNTVGATSLTLSSSDISLQSPAISLSGQSLSISVGGFSMSSDGIGISLGGGPASGVATQTSISALVTPILPIVQGVAASLTSPTPVLGPQIAPAIQAIATLLTGLSGPGGYSSIVKAG